MQKKIIYKVMARQLNVSIDEAIYEKLRALSARIPLPMTDLVRMYLYRDIDKIVKHWDQILEGGEAK